MAAPSGKFDLSDYVDVNERIAEMFLKYETGSLQSEMYEVRDAAGELIAWGCKAYAYRTPDDPRPGIGHAVEVVPGKTPYTRDSEAMNAETSAWGRAIVALGFPTKKIASAQEVRARTGGADAVAERPSEDAASSASAPNNPAERARQAYEAANPSPNYDGSAESVELPFGKHKGKTIGELVEVDRGYLNWLASTYDAKTPAQRLVVNAARFALAPIPPSVDDGIPF